MKHAYLIMAHNNFEGLMKMLTLIDDYRNDIYIHIDKKVKNVPISRIKESVHKSNLVFVKSVNVAWGGYSQIEAELTLLKAAIKREYAYYHLLSGNDLPLLNQDEIHTFFEKNKGVEYMSFFEPTETESMVSERIEQYHFLQDFIGRNKGKIIAALSYVEEFSLKCQRRMRVNRQKNSQVVFYKGETWFSITDNMAKYILQEEAFIRKNFRFGLCIDELFLQTLAMQSPYKNNVAGESLRYTDWNRGCPYTFTTEDFDVLMDSGRLFARKFDYLNHPEIVEKIVQKILQNE